MKRCEVWWVQFDPALSTEIKTSYSGEAQIRCWLAIRFTVDAWRSGGVLKRVLWRSRNLRKPHN